MRDFGECERVREDAKIVITDPGSGNNRSKFRLENPNKLKIREVKVDDCVIKQGMRCDYLVIAPGQEIYIELKGSNVKHAVEQLATTIEHKHIKQLTDKSSLKLCFIASTRCPINSTEIQNLKKKFKQKYQAKLTIKNGEIIHKL